ncbi:MAG: AAA family ATPase [Anaerolineae bacterium]|jgi:hypothetical protein|nr:AAA family ATPase [Anaerolineae bacterium]
MLGFITGAGGSGRAAVLPLLRRRLPQMAVHAFEAHPRWGPGPPATPAQRQQVTEAWLQTALAAPQPLLVVGAAIMGEVLACPSAPQAGHIAFCLLDCDDGTRLERLRRRGAAPADGRELLAWAAWLRGHHADPQFGPQVLRRGAHPMMRWSRWQGWQAPHPYWRCHRIDTTCLRLAQVADQVVGWLQDEQVLYDHGYRLQLTAHPEAE